eukprot:3145230-Heterocapsa_arctica.AAC.1
MLSVSLCLSSRAFSRARPPRESVSAEALPQETGAAPSRARRVAQPAGRMACGAQAKRLSPTTAV